MQSHLIFSHLGRSTQHELLTLIAKTGHFLKNLSTLWPPYYFSMGTERAKKSTVTILSSSGSYHLVLNVTFEVVFAEATFVAVKICGHNGLYRNCCQLLTIGTRA